ncbi:hypothetical protein AQUCO_00700714v1 [Aquilegia coerulea]|uniref:AP2/ERF domain-containing protein n=1 Tax=Aquilegia coerulea TaxID=218851 RepID=A0A2G5ELB6_AQUCA|nr:hypothetical protein AQUCO_00700714v1 [Aquilegia coerulea]
MWDLNDSPDELHHHHEEPSSGEREDEKGKRVGLNSNENSSSSAHVFNIEDGSDNEEEEEEKEEVGRKRSHKIFGFSFTHDNDDDEDEENDNYCSSEPVVTRQLFPVNDDQSEMGSTTTAENSGMGMGKTAPFPRAQWVGVKFCHSDPVIGSSQSQPIKKSRRGPRSRSSQYRGVTFYRRTGRWESHIWDCGKQVYLGGFDTAHAAARAYDRAAIKFRGVEADINFSLDDYEDDLKQMTNLTKEEFVHVLRRQSTGFPRGSSKFRGVTLHKCGRWEARMGQFLDMCILVSSILKQKLQGNNAVHNLDLSLGNSTSTSDSHESRDDNRLHAMDPRYSQMPYVSDWSNNQRCSMRKFDANANHMGANHSYLYKQNAYSESEAIRLLNQTHIQSPPNRLNASEPFIYGQPRRSGEVSMFHIAQPQFSPPNYQLPNSDNGGLTGLGGGGGPSLPTGEQLRQSGWNRSSNSWLAGTPYATPAASSGFPLQIIRPTTAWPTNSFHSHMRST